jgi:hypothetical protein
VNYGLTELGRSTGPTKLTGLYSLALFTGLTGVTDLLLREFMSPLLIYYADITAASRTFTLVLRIDSIKLR